MSKILEMRMQTGEPYLVFIDTANKALSKHQRELGLKIKMSNLCSEILLPTGPDHLENDRTAVCCLSSLNAETWDEWHDDPLIIEDVLRFLDNVLQAFIDEAPKGMERATYSATRERSVGLGLMGFHSFLQLKSLSFESALAKSWNMKMFRHIRKAADAASVQLAKERGACLDAKEKGVLARFSHKLAIAPTASISIICGGTSAGIEPIPANIYNHKTLSGNFVVKNPHLEKLLVNKGLNTDDIWQSIIEQEGSVGHIDQLNQHEKDTFKTAFEIDQRWPPNSLVVGSNWVLCHSFRQISFQMFQIPGLSSTLVCSVDPELKKDDKTQWVCRSFLKSMQRCYLMKLLFHSQN
jgi:ribonucleoside-diphosphate reductase alpha chain